MPQQPVSYVWPWSLNQPTEVWALSKIRFILKPHRRIWDQSGAKQLVTITAPKNTEPSRSSGLSQTEVRSRLRALADVIDSRGWAIKNVNLNLYSQPLPIMAVNDTDRLIDIANLPQEVPTVDVQSTDDILDENNPISQHFQQMITSTNSMHHSQILQQLQTLNGQQNPAIAAQPAPAQTNPDEPLPDYWFMNNPTPTKIPADNAMFDTQVVGPTGSPSSIANEEISLMKLRENKTPDPAFAKMRRLSSQKPETTQPPKTQAKPTMTPQQDPAILEFAGNDDLNVATIERLANQEQSKQQPPDEVIVPLH